jgi:hypothetical protein
MVATNAAEPMDAVPAAEATVDEPVVLADADMAGEATSADI